jgi:hypothetical protein
MKRPPAPGKKVTCPDCEHRFIPSDDEPEEEPSKKKKRPRDDDDDSDRRPRKKKKQQQSNAMLWILLAGGGGLLLLVVAGGVVALILILNKDKGSSTSTASGTSKGSDSGWSPDAKYRDKLGPASSVIVKYQMDIPKGYQPANFGSELISSDPRMPTLELNIDNSNPQGLEYLRKQPNYDAERNVDGILKGFGYRNVQKGKTESGTLAGGTFYRIRYTSNNAANKKVSGFYYIGICDKDLIFVYTLGVGTGASLQEPATEDAVNTLEAALLTLRPGSGPR